MNEMECLSLMELLDLRAGVDDPEARRHVDGCPRCRVLLDGVPAEITLPALPATTVMLRARSSQTRPERVRTGQLWRAHVSGEGDRSWIVAVIGRAPDAENRILVVPAVAEPELATERDLVVDATALGYDGFLDLQNLGPVMRTQLVEYLGTLSSPQIEALVALYRWTLGGNSEPTGLPTGPPVLGEADPRLLAAEERGEELRALWRNADAQVTDVEEAQEERDLDSERPLGTQLDQGHEPKAGLTEILQLRLKGPSAEWDRASLLERTGVDGGHFDQFVKGRLDLTDKTDVQDLANVLHALDIPRDEAENAVAISLWVSPGGRREATGPAMPMAARSQPGISEEDVTRDLYADQSEIDRSAKARSAEIAAYLAELRHALDELA
jgi:hypothetical protein